MSLLRAITANRFSRPSRPSFPKPGSGWSAAVWKKVKQAEFTVGWQIQARLSTPCLAIMVAFLPARLGLVLLPIVALGWSLSATLYYEWRRRYGLPDQYFQPVSLDGRRFWGRLWYVVKVALILGPVNFLTTKGLCRLQRPEPIGRGGSVWQKMILFLGTGKSGVMASHHFLEKSGYSSKSIFKLNLLGRVFELPFKVIDALLLYKVYDYFGVFNLALRAYHLLTEMIRVHI